MKTLTKYLGIIILVVGAFTACSDDELDTNPTDRVSGATIFQDEAAAQTALDGCYALLYQGVFVSGNVNHAEGHQSTILAQELMADDMVITNLNNWYGWDYSLYYTKSLGTGQLNTSSRSYNIWNMMYTIISNMNYVLDQEGNLGQNGNEAKNILAQAYALRAFAYFELIQDFQKTYIGNQSLPGVPVYTEPTLAGAEGKPRGTVEDVYVQINADIKSAIDLFTEVGKPSQKHCSHVDYYVAKGFEARMNLVQGKWQEAYNSAAEARSRSGNRLLSSSEILGGMNDKGLASNLWCMEVITEQAPIYLYYMDYRGTNGGLNQRKCISRWLYDKINRYPDDARLAWFKDGNQGSSLTGENVNYGQMKILMKDVGTWEGDLTFMRSEEMLLIQAEAKARLGAYGDARQLLKDLTNVRLKTATARDNYSGYLTNLANASTVPVNDTHIDPTNVLEEVLIQRRIELWGEAGRIKDILRLKQTFNRRYDGNNHLDYLVDVNPVAESGAFIFKIPQREFDGNKNILSNEQNPIR
jgi:SusD family.